MTLSDKINEIGKFYNIVGWNALSNRERMSAVKDRTGEDTVEAAYDHIQAERRKASPSKPAQPATKTSNATILPPAKSQAETPAPSNKVEFIAPPGAPITVHGPTLQVAAGAPVVIEPRREPPQWWELAGRAGYWVQVFALGLLVGVLIGGKVLSLVRVASGG